MALTLKEIEELITNLVGEDILPLIRLLFGKQNISEFILAEQLNITVNQVRNMLYRMYEQNLVSFQRKKDKKKGWYIYYWTLELRKLEETLEVFKRKQLDDFKLRLDREQSSNFFVCSNGCMRMSMENAMEQEFKCHECGNLLKPLDNQRTIENLKQRIIELEQEFNQPEQIIKPKKEKKTKKKEKKSKISFLKKSKTSKLLKKVKKSLNKKKRI